MILISDDDHDDEDDDRRSFPGKPVSLKPLSSTPFQINVSKNRKKTKTKKTQRNEAAGTRKLSESQSISFATKIQDGKNWLHPKEIQSWASRYSPKKISDLAIHSRKVADVREWLEAKLQNSKKMQIHNGGNVLVLSGPSGSGKTALVRVLVDLLDAELCEWDPPVPTLWKEHLHHVNSDIPYMSKMDEFIEFLGKVKKYPSLPLVQVSPDGRNKSVHAGATSGMKPKLILIDDLPIVKGREFASKLCHCLHNFAVSVQFQTIVIVTDFLETRENGKETSSVTTDVLQSLESGGAKKITFNPITANAIRKVLNKIVVAEKCVASSATLSFIAESCGGDIRHAIHSLQFLCLGQNPIASTWDPGGDTNSFANSKRRKVSTDLDRKHGSLDLEFSLSSNKHEPFGCRDSVLTVFHALGKVLYNKRVTENIKDSGESSIGMIIKCDLQRHPLNMEAPEIILAQCHGEAASFMSFLHENFLEFVDDEAIEDVSVSLAYFSDVDSLLNKRLRFRDRMVLTSSDDIDPGLVAEAVAGSIAARSVLFANTHPAKHRWQSIRAPVMRQVERLSNEKKVELRLKSWACIMERSTMITNAVQATEWEPYSKHLINKTRSPSLLPLPLREASDVNFDVFGDDFFDLSLVPSEEQELTSHIASMDMSSAYHGMEAAEAGSDDEIEEW